MHSQLLGVDFLRTSSLASFEFYREKSLGGRTFF